MAVRVVFELDELRKRLAIWDAGLDDAHVEYAKLTCLAENPSIRGPDGRTGSTRPGRHDFLRYPITASSRSIAI